jgi:DNA-binding transcriptional MerR regulator
MRDETRGLSERGDEEGARESAKDLIGIGDLAREFGVSVRTLRFYQSKGLLSTHWSGRARAFRPEDRDRLAAILQGKRLGFSLNEIRDIAGACQTTLDDGLPLPLDKCLAQIERLERQRWDIERSLADLRNMRTVLEEGVERENPKPVRRVKAS